MRGVHLIRSASTLLLCLYFSSIAFAEDQIQIPARISSLARYFGDRLDTDPEYFTISLNKLLLEQSNSAQNWDQNSARVDLVHYLEDLDELKREFGSRIEIGTQPKIVRKRLEDLADFSAQYSLSYKPPSGAPGLRNVEVRVRESKYKVRFRKSYYYKE